MIFKLVFLACWLGVVSAQKNVVLVGGGLSDGNAQIWGKVIDLAGGGSFARIGVVTAASADPEDSADYYIEMFQTYGAEEVYWIPVHEGNTDANRDPEVVDNIQRMTGFFFGGGDQRRIISSFYNNGREESPALAAIKATYAAGAVVGGTSAGAVCMGSAVMITGGYSWEALRWGAWVDGSESHPDELTYDPEGGLGIIDGIIVDSHFSERGREGRLVRLVADTRGEPHGVTRGVGVDEDTALVVYNVGTGSEYGEVIGEQGVFFTDITRADINPPGMQYWGISDLDTHYLTQDDTINMGTWAVTFASWKSNMVGQEANDIASISERIFNGNRDDPSRPAEYPRTSTSLLDARVDVQTWGITQESGPRFRVWFEKTFRTVGFGGRNPNHNRFDIAYENLDVEMIANE